MASEILLSLSQSPRQGPPAVLFPLLPFPVVEHHPCHWLQEPGSGFAPCGAYSSITEYKPKLRAPLGSRGQGRWFQPSLACSAYGAEVSLNLLLWLLPSLAQQITPKQWLKSTSFFFFFTCRDVVIQEFGQGSAEGFFFSIWHLLRSLGVFKWCVDQSGMFRTVAVMARRLSVAGILVLSMNMRSRWSQHRLLI